MNGTVFPQNGIHIRDRLTLHPESGTCDVIFEAVPVLQGATAAVSYRVLKSFPPAPGLREANESRQLSLRGPEVSYGIGQTEMEFSRADGHIKLDWRLRPGKGLDLWLEVTNVGNQPVQIDELRVLDLPAGDGALELGTPARYWSVYQNGWQSWSPTFARHTDNGTYVDPQNDDYRLKHQPHTPTRGINSEWVTVIAPRPPLAQGISLLIGFITLADQLAEVRLELDEQLQFTHLQAICYADGIALQPGERLFSERLTLTAGEDPLALLESYAARLGETMHARPADNPPTGWCTWYYFYGENTADDVLDNLQLIESQRLPLDYVLIDDGYQAAIGDWLHVDADKFPADMAALARQIKAAGRRPGIWTAPFGVEAEAPLVTAHPDWLLRDEAGEPVVAWTHMGRGPVYALDLTHPQVQDWLADTFRTMRQEWGYELFKIDFLFAAALPGRRHDPQITRAQALRQGVSIIRQAIGNDAFLLGCGAPLGPCLGLVDGMRIGPDVAPNWKPFWQDLSMPAMENALRNVMTRAFIHNHWWVNDPDCLLIRTRDDESDLKLNEMRTATTLIGLSGGAAFLSDNLVTLRPGRLKYLRQILPPLGQAARTLDLFEHEMPRLLMLPISRPWGEGVVVACINWEDHTVSTTLDLDALGLPKGYYHVYNYWRRRYLGQVEGSLTIGRHQPHETVLLLFKPVSDRPELLTSTFHVAQGAVEVADASWQGTWEKGRTLILRLEKPGEQYGRLLFAVPTDYRVTGCRVNGRRRQAQQVAAGVIELGFTLQDAAQVELDFTTQHATRNA
ncbi:MAG: alpha-galactosidase [Anaerolineae bacterium]|jgi:alpha-galactosidase|nr:alpha-galactosidase [Anaerolineae bacterium]MDH7473546.1 alpha-galactosidase [Anaerolineae bacterium]